MHNNFDGILQHIRSLPETTAKEEAEARQQQLLGMIKLAILLWLPSDFIDALDECRNTLIDETPNDHDTQ